MQKLYKKMFYIINIYLINSLLYYETIKMKNVELCQNVFLQNGEKLLHFFRNGV